MADSETKDPGNWNVVLDGFRVPDRVATSSPATSGAATAASSDVGHGLCELAFKTAATAVDFPHWLEPPVRQLHADVMQSQSHHAMLIHGPAGSGKRLLAETLIALRMCRSPMTTSRDVPVACGECNDCRQLASGNHIDLRVLKRSEKSDIIKIDDMREFLAWLMITSRAADCYRVGVIDCADELNASSANALLKTLEEPAASSVIVLISDNLRTLPATLKSRCLLVPVNAVPSERTIQWLSDRGVDQPGPLLRQSHNAPLHVLAVLDDGQGEHKQRMLQCFAGIVTRQAGIAVCVERLKDYSAKDCLLAFSEFTSDILRVRLNAQASCLYPQEISRWQTLAEHLSQPQWFALYRDLQHLMSTDIPGIKVQPVLETIFAAIWQTGEVSSSLTLG